MDLEAHPEPAGETAGRGTGPDSGGEGGDPVCWLHRVCPECGRIADVAPPTTCTRCGAAVEG